MLLTFQSALSHMSASLNMIAPALLLCQIDEPNYDYEYPGPIDDDEDQPFTLITDSSMNFTDVRDFFATLRREPVEIQSPTTCLPPRRFVMVSHKIKIGAVVAAMWTDNEYYPAVVTMQCARNMFKVRFLADGVDYIAHTRSIHLNPKFGMCPRDQRVWSTGCVKTFDKKQYRF